MTKITFDSGPPDFPKNSYLTIRGMPWYKSKLKIIDSKEYTLTYKWCWWEESWFRVPTVILIYTIAIYLLFNI